MENVSRNGRNWLVVPHRFPSGRPADIRPDVLRDLLDALADAPDDGKAQVRVGLLRELVQAALADVDDPGTLGASIHDHDQRTTYRATVGRGEGAVWLESLQIEHTDGRPVDRADLRRVPVQQIAEATAQCIEENSEPGVLVVRDGELELDADRRTDMPSSEELAALMREGHNRRTLAVRYSRSLSTVDDWIGRARREVPELMPPPGKGGRPRKKQPKTSSSDQHDDQDTKGTGR